MRILQLIGGAALVMRLFGTVAEELQSRIVYEFKGLSLNDFNLFAGKAKLTLVITNNNPFPFDVNGVDGTISFGRISTPIIMEKAFTVEPGQKVSARFTVPIENSTLLEQIGDQIQSGELPALRLVAGINAGMKGKSVTLPVNTQIPLL